MKSLRPRQMASGPQWTKAVGVVISMDKNNGPTGVTSRNAASVTFVAVPRSGSADPDGVTVWLSVTLTHKGIPGRSPLLAQACVHEREHALTPWQSCGN